MLIPTFIIVFPEKKHTYRIYLKLCCTVVILSYLFTLLSRSVLFSFRVTSSLELTRTRTPSLYLCGCLGWFLPNKMLRVNGDPWCFYSIVIGNRTKPEGLPLRWAHFTPPSRDPGVGSDSSTPPTATTSSTAAVHRVVDMVVFHPYVKIFHLERVWDESSPKCACVGRKLPRADVWIAGFWKLDESEFFEIEYIKMGTIWMCIE